MAVKRNGSDDGYDHEAGSPNGTATEAYLMRPAGPPPRADHATGEERMSIFWRVFGGTILSIAALAAVTMYNAVTTNVSELRSELARGRAELDRANADIRAELSRSHEARADLLRKDEFSTRMTTSWDAVRAIQAQNTTQNATLAAQRTELDALKDRANRQAADFEAVKKDQAATTDALKKDVAALDALKDRLAATATELKLVKDDTHLVKQQLDRNQAYDQERKEYRDKQSKLFDEAMKELQKGVQDCREKLARLEGPQGPPAPVTPKPTPPAGPKE